MTIEEKAKAYDEAIKIAKETYNTQPMYRNWLESMFPELQENEIKDMREKLIKAFGSIGKKEWGGVNVKDVIHWLEKQGQVKESTISQHEIETCKDNVNSLTFEDEKVRKTLIDFFGRGAKYGGQTNGVYDKDIIAWLEKQGKTSPVLSNSSNNGKDEQKQEWSEEEDDDAWMNDIISKVENNLQLNKAEIDWLKSLKLQPKQSLDEDTQQWVDTIIKDYEDLYNTDKDHSATIQAKISILKSLRPQNTWKPSDEQIKVCKEVYADLLSAKGFDLGTVVSELNRLEEGLKKKGE